MTTVRNKLWIRTWESVWALEDEQAQIWSWVGESVGDLIADRVWQVSVPTLEEINQ